MDDARLPAHLEVAGLIRQTQSLGGFATVIQRGERDAGTILIVMCENARNSRLYERMPSADGGRIWQLSLAQDVENKQYFEDYLARRKAQDPDSWMIELDIAQAERLIGLDPVTR